MVTNLPFLSSSKKTINQKGGSLVIAIFIMVVMMLLGTTLVELLTTSSEGVAQEVLGTRALAAANSGMQGQLQQLFPLDGGTAVCPASTTYNGFSNTRGLHYCSATVTCNNYVTDPIKGINYYRLTSKGSCGTGVIIDTSKDIVLSSRTVQVEARSL